MPREHILILGISHYHKNSWRYFTPALVGTYTVANACWPSIGRRCLVTRVRRIQCLKLLRRQCQCAGDGVFLYVRRRAGGRQHSLPFAVYLARGIEPNPKTLPWQEDMK